jgi:(p)ppGpp synthase/HD superfamily hydrolase
MSPTNFITPVSEGQFTLDHAIGIAVAAHSGQRDKNGVTPYIAHPMAVMAAVSMEHPSNVDAQIIAVLHDVVEDTPYTMDTLVFGAGLPTRLIHHLDAVTRRAGEPYEVYVRRAARDPIGHIVKRADVFHNLEESRLALLPRPMQMRLRAKYATALAILRECAPLHA